jgi:hypothetical protein
LPENIVGRLKHPVSAALLRLVSTSFQAQAMPHTVEQFWLLRHFTALLIFLARDILKASRVFANRPGD